MSFPGADQTERVIYHEEACRRQLYWMSKDWHAWNRNPKSYNAELLLMDP